MHSFPVPVYHPSDLNYNNIRYIHHYISKLPPRKSQRKEIVSPLSCKTLWIGGFRWLCTSNIIHEGQLIRDYSPEGLVFVECYVLWTWKTTSSDPNEEDKTSDLILYLPHFLATIKTSVIGPIIVLSFIYVIYCLYLPFLATNINELLLTWR
jgi:hypothetical protein